MDATQEYGEGSHVGLVRTNNEDAILSAPDVGLWLIADGMGGHNAGEVASDIVRNSVAQAIHQGKSIIDAIQQSHREVIEEAEKDQSRRNMGTTIVSLLCKGKHYEIAWVGDSRAYLWNANTNTLEQISKDHSYVQSLVDNGIISKAEMDTHPQRNVITQSLGVSDIDGLIVDTINKEWHAGEKILLCSDGLTDLLSDEEIINIFRKCRNKNNQELVNTLIESALEKGGIDNVSVQVISAPDLSQLASTVINGNHIHKTALAIVTISLFTAFIWLFKKY